METHRSTKVASRAILEAIHFGQFKLPRLRRHFEDPPSQQTINRILRQLEEEGWLERAAPRSSIWRAGPITRSLCDSDGHPVQAGTNRTGPSDGD